MKKQGNLYRSITAVVIITALILLVPLVAMQYTNEVDWHGSDFIIMGALISGTGITYVLLTQSAPNIIYRIAVAMALGSTLLMIWVNLAVGLIGSGPNAGNLMFIGVVTVLITGIIRSGFKAAGMERTMYATALSLAALIIIALLTGMQRYPGSSVKDIAGVGGFFAALFLAAGILFRYAAKKQMVHRQMH